MVPAAPVTRACNRGRTRPVSAGDERAQPTNRPQQQLIMFLIEHFKVNKLILESRVPKGPIFQSGKLKPPVLTAAGRVGALSALLVKTLALGPAVHGRAAAPLPLLRAAVTGDAAARPWPPLQPLTLHWRDSKWDGHMEGDASGEREFG